METKRFNIDELFRRRFDNHSLNPSESLLKHIRFRLWTADFLSFNLKTFNIVYTLILITGISIPFILNSEKQTESSTNPNIVNLPATDEFSKNNNQPATNLIADSALSDKTELAENSLPLLSFEPSLTQGCIPLAVEFRNHSKNAEKYFWNFGNGKTSSEINPKVVFSKEGQYTITLTATSSSGIKNTLKQTVIVYPKPIAAAEIDIENSEIKSRKVVFLNKSKDASSYLWNFGDNVTSTNANALHNYKKNGKYQVALVAYSAYGCSDTAIIENHFIEKNFELSFPPKFRPGTYNSQNSGFYENAAEQNLIFYPLNNGVQSYELKIFAPNGTEIFKTSNIKQGWNGFIKGRIAPPGRYSFSAKGIYPNGKKFEIRSFVDVIVDEVNGYY